MTTSLSMDRATFQAAIDANQPTVVRVAAELDVDVSPLGAYAGVSGRSTNGPAAPYSFLLESGGKTASTDPDGAFRPSEAIMERHARYSFVGYDPAAVITVGGDDTTLEVLGPERYEECLEPGEGDVLDVLRGIMPDVHRAGFASADRQRLDGGLVGFLSYDAVYDLHLSEVGRSRPETDVPDAQYVLATKVLAFDELAGTVELVFTPLIRPGDDAGAIYDALTEEASRVAALLNDCPEPTPGGATITDQQAGPRDAYEDAVRQAKEHVLDGDIYQGVLSRTRELTGEVDSLALYEALRSINPSPYMYLLDHDDRTLVGASPETLVSVRDETVMVNPIAGTCPRGESPVEDRRLAGEMLADDKERAEHTMLVDLARNDVRRVAEAGSVRVEEFMNVLKYSHVQHIESTVTGTVREGCDAFDAMRAAFPAGTLSGAPKIRAMEIIDDLEQTPRGVYGGGVGYFSWTGVADSAIVIRSALIEDENGQQTVSVRAGAGLVAGSDPTAEFAETESKMDGVLAALESITDGQDLGGDRP